VYIETGECKSLSRSVRFLRFDSLRAELAKLLVLDAILVGEIVCLEQDGVSRFNDLLDRKTQPVFYAFDLLMRNGEVLRQQSLIERKQRLSVLVRQRERTIYPQHVEKDGQESFKEMWAQDLEGMVAKRKLRVSKTAGMRS